ncbi:RNA polymerase III C11 subunit [Lobaria immixta]|nr:RNA polymerase III C11 subunit [Lobaria immixta]
MLLFCPCCSNSLTVTRGQGSNDYPSGQNRLECRTCPYRFIIERRYFERKDMKRKMVEDVMGGKDAWANVDKTDGKFLTIQISPRAHSFK